jgi:hypothetical protein
MSKRKKEEEIRKALVIEAQKTMFRVSQQRINSYASYALNMHRGINEEARKEHTRLLEDFGNAFLTHIKSKILPVQEFLPPQDLPARPDGQPIDMVAQDSPQKSQTSTNPPSSLTSSLYPPEESKEPSAQVKKMEKLIKDNEVLRKEVDFWKKTHRTLQVQFKKHLEATKPLRDKTRSKS